MAIKTEFVNFSVSDGTTMRAYVAHPEGAPRAGIMVFQEIFGVNAHIRDVTERFAREGYMAIAPELFHRTGPGFEGKYDDFQAVMSHVAALSNRQIEADIRATHEWLRPNGEKELPVAVVGFCMGGMVSFLAGITLPIAAA